MIAQRREDELVKVAEEMIANPSPVRVSIPMSLLPMTPEEILLLAKVVRAARSYFQHHISQAPHSPHAEAVTAALAALDDTQNQHFGKEGER